MDEPIEKETHHNQKMTSGAAARVTTDQAAKEVKKTVVLRLNAAEYAAFERLGGIAGLKERLLQAD